MIFLFKSELVSGARGYQMRKWLLPFLIFFIALYSYSSTIQTEKKQQTIQHEVTVTLRLVQVYVADKKGNPVLDLNKEDFTIHDNGKKQQITAFEKHILSLPSAKSEIQPEIIQETKIPSPREIMNRKFFLLFDFAYNNPKGILKTKEAALHFIDTQLTRSDEVGVFSYSALKSLVFHEYLTTDHRIVRKVVGSLGLKDSAGRAENLEEQYWREITGENPLDPSKRGGVFDKEKEILLKRNEERIEQIREMLQHSQMSREQVRALLRSSPEFEKFEALQDTRLHALSFIQKIKELANALRYIPGYKHIILFSSGIPYSFLYGIQSPFGGVQSDGNWGDSLLRQRYESMLKELAASNSILYTLDTEDLATKISGDVRMTGAFSLEKMANATGGKYFGNINNYEEHLQKIQALTGCYYVLGYYVDEKWDGKYHEIKVEINRPGCEVHGQRGYFNPKPFSEYSNLEKMLHLVDLALNERSLFETPLRFPMRALPCSIKGKTNLFLFSCIPMEKIQEIAGKEAEMVSIIFDKEDNIVKMQKEKIDFTQLPRSNIYYSTLLALDPGDYKCRLVIRNLETGRGAVASSLVIIPRNPDSGIKLDPPLLLKIEKDALFLKKPSAIYSFDATKYSPVIDELAQGEKSLHGMVRCSFFGIEKPEIRLSASFITPFPYTGKAMPVSISVLDRYQEDGTEIFFIELQTEELKVGEYFLYIFAEEMKTKSISRANTSFKVSLNSTRLDTNFLSNLSQDILSQNASHKALQEKLAKILEKTSEYCNRMEKAALDFVCFEEVSERIDLTRDIIQSRLAYITAGTRQGFVSRIEPVKINKYKYDYQLVRKGDQIKESRILLEEDFQRKFEKDADLKTSVFTFNKFFFSPAAVLSAERQNYYYYQIIKEEIWDGEKVVLIEANPKPSLAQNIISGKIWVRERDFSILKMEYHQKSIVNFWVLEERAKRYKADPEITAIAEYGVEKNAIRFPSRCFIKEAYKDKKGGEFVRSETTVIYKNYRFFTVETEVRFK